MTKYGYIGLTAIAVLFTACAASQLPPIDDAYHWSDKTPVAQTAPTSPNPQNIPNTPNTPNTPNIPNTQTVSQEPRANSQQPSLEYLNIQDTTVTIRIKK